jgi:hypothetical protein
MSIFKESFNPNVQNSLEARQNLMGKSIRTPQELTFLNSNTNFVSLKSSVDVNGDDGKLAKENVLIGGTLNNKVLRYGIDDAGEGAYSTKTSSGAKHVLGMRPMPGITSIEVHNKAAYGSTRIATVNFQCWDVEQLNILEALYMRPGYTVLLEFGRNNYIDTKGNLRQVAPADDFFTKKNVVLIDYLNELYKRSTDSSGNYDALFGYIINYGWSARNDGGYDCKTEIVTTGEILESLKVNYTVGLVNFEKLGIKSASTSTPPPLVKATDTNLPTFTGLLHDSVNRAYGNKLNYEYLITYSRINEEYSQNVLSGLIYEFFRLCTELEKENAVNSLSSTSTSIGVQTNLGVLNTKDSLLSVSSFTGSLNYAAVKYNSTNQEDPDYKIIKSSDEYGDIYITLSSFVDLINKYLILTNPTRANSPLTKLSVHDRGYLGKDSKEQATRENTPLYCLFHPLMTSVNPDACLINNNQWINLLSEVDLGTQWTGDPDKIGNDIGFAPDPKMVSIVKNTITTLLADGGNYESSIPSGLKTEVKIINNLNAAAETLKMTPEAFAKAFNEHYIYLRSGKLNNTYTFKNWNTPPETLSKLGSSISKTFDVFWLNYLQKPIFDSRFGTGDAVYTKAIFSYDKTQLSKLEDKYDNEQKLYDDLQKLNQTQRDINLSSSKASEWWRENIFNKLTQTFIEDTGSKMFGKIGNIYLNTKFLYKMAKDQSLQQQDTSGKQSLLILNYLKAVMQEVQTSLGNVNNFEIIIDDRDGVGRIVDLNYVNLDEENLFKFEIGSNNSIIKDIKIESEISNNMTSMIAIAAQSSAGAFGLDNSTLVSYNAGILDRVIPKKDSPIYSQNGTIVSQGLQIDGFVSALSVIAKFFQTFGGTSPDVPGTFEAQNANSNKSALREIINFFTATQNSPNSNKAFLPSKISLTIDGLSGIVIGNLFDVDKTFIPKFYKGNPQGRDLGYIVVNVAHSISSNVWNTTVQGYPFIIDKDNNLYKIDQYQNRLRLIVTYDSVNNTKTTSTNPGPSFGSIQKAADNAEKSNPGFREKVRSVAKAIGANENDLLKIMFIESAFTLDPARYNNIGCVGLIQFCPDEGQKIIKTIGKKTYRIADLARMNRIQQMDVVQEYFQSQGYRGNKTLSLTTMYLSTFYPVAIGKPSTFIIGSEPGRKPGYKFEIANDNPGIAADSTREIQGKKVIDVDAVTRFITK